MSTPAGSGSWAARRLGRIYIALAALAWSSAGLVQRGISVNTVTQVAGRAVFAFLALLAFTAVMEHGNPWRVFRTMGWSGLGFAVTDGPRRSRMPGLRGQRIVLRREFSCPRKLRNARAFALVQL